MRRILTVMLGLLMICSQLLAQNRTVSGKVTDQTGNPVANASVTVKGTTIGITTSTDGTFRVSVPSTAKALVISSVNFETAEWTIGSSNVVNASLKSTETAMQEVVVIGYGTGKRVGSVVGDFTSVNGAKMQERPTANALDALQGKVAGLQVFTSNGEPSQISSVRLHGVGSLGASSTPLFVMDGVPIDQGTMISLNPEDFESITVLKDASATSIYGSRAANGVIYITTKKGSPNKPATVTLKTQYGVQNLANPDFFNKVMNTKQLTDFWVATGYRTQAQVDALLAQYNADTKWYKVYYKDNVPMYQADLSVSGGGGKTSYYLSAGYLDQAGVAYRSAFKRYTLRSNLNSSVNDYIKVGLNLFIDNDDRQTNPYGANNLNRGLALLAQPFYSPVDASGIQYQYIPGLGRYHPAYLTKEVQATGNNIQFNPTAYIQVTPVKNLTLKSTGGIDAYDYRSSSVTLPSYLGSVNNGNAAEGFSRGITKTINNTAEYKFSVTNQHNFTALVGQEYIGNITTAFNTSATGLTDDRLVMLTNGPNNRTSTSSKTEYAYQSFFSRLEYNMSNRYFIDGSFRQDQSSRFGKDVRTANFYSVGAMWKAKQEKFFTDIKWLSDLVVKASVGTTGNSSIDNYQSLPLVGSYDLYNARTNLYDNQSAWGISAPGNPDLSWETQQNASVGLKFSIFDRARFDISYYDRKTKNMLISVPYPYTSGFANIISNVGSLKNTGVDVTFDADIYKTSKAYITPYVNFNYNKNEVTDLFQGKQYWIIPNTGVCWAIGQPVSFFYPIFAQVNPETGLPEWYQRNVDPAAIVNTRKDPTAVTTTFTSSALEQNTGIKRYPPFNGGFGLNAGYSGLYLSADFSFSQGKYLINNDKYFFENPSVFPGYDQSAAVLDYWKKAGDLTLYPKYGVQFTQFDSRLIEDASFMRLKSLTIGYQVPSTVLNKTHVIKDVRVYATGRNLITVTKYTGPDPEVDSNLTYGVNPNTKQVAVGLNFTF